MKLSQWLKDNPWIVAILTVVGMVLSSFGIVKFTVKQNTGQEPEIIFIVNDTMPTDEGPQVLQARKGLLHPLFMARCKVQAARQLAKEKAISFNKAYAAVNKVDETKVAAFAMDYVDLNVVGADGPIKRLIDWLSDPANQEKLKAFIEFIMGLAVLFL